MNISPKETHSYETAMVPPQCPVPEDEEYLLSPSLYRGGVKCHEYDGLPDDVRNKIKALWNLSKKQVECFWTMEEIDFSRDEKDFQGLSQDEKYVIEKILGFFVNSDNIINVGLNKLQDKMMLVEVRSGYIIQQFMENIHGETYAAMIDKIIPDKARQEELHNSVMNDPFIRKISEWVLFRIYGKKLSYEEHIKGSGDYDINIEANLGKILVGMACMEGIVFSGAFAVIYWIRELKCKNKMVLKGLIQSNDFIARDEGLHACFGCLMYSLVKKKMSEDEIHDMIKDIVNITKEFNESSIRSNLIGLSVDSMNQYTEYIADRLCVMLGYGKIYNTKLPFKFMEKIMLLPKDNFFDMRSTAYQKPLIEKDIYENEDALYSDDNSTKEE